MYETNKMSLNLNKKLSNKMGRLVKVDDRSTIKFNIYILLKLKKKKSLLHFAFKNFDIALLKSTTSGIL